MSPRKLGVAAAAGAVLLLPVALAVAQQRAIRSSAASCYQTVGTTYTVYADLYASSTANLHDWGIGSKWYAQNPPLSLETSTVYCPVVMDMPRTNVNAFEGVRILYSTREANIVNGSGLVNFTPEIKSCSVYIMDGTEEGSWFNTTNPLGPPAGANTGSLFTTGEIFISGSTLRLGSTSMRRMLITCQLPRGLYYAGSLTYTAMIKGYAVEYTQ
jgi:hypothetical protein